MQYTETALIRVPELVKTGIQSQIASEFAANSRRVVIRDSDARVTYGIFRSGFAYDLYVIDPVEASLIPLVDVPADQLFPAFEGHLSHLQILCCGLGVNRPKADPILDFEETTGKLTNGENEKKYLQWVWSNICSKIEGKDIAVSMKGSAYAISPSVKNEHLRDSIYLKPLFRQPAYRFPSTLAGGSRTCEKIIEIWDNAVFLTLL